MTVIGLGRLAFEALGDFANERADVGRLELQLQTARRQLLDVEQLGHEIGQAHELAIDAENLLLLARLFEMRAHERI